MSINYEELLKITALLKKEKKRMCLGSIEISFDSNKNLIVLAERISDFEKQENSWIVFTAYNTGEMNTSYAGFNNGNYDLSYDNAKVIFNNRRKK